MQSWVKRIHRFEDALLVALLSTMILLAATQIGLRNFFDSGLVWADPLLRVLVLWLGLIGATVATRENRHIRIDLLNRFIERNSRRLTEAIIGQVSAWVCLVIAWYGMTWIRLDYEAEVTAMLDLPAWVLEIIVPLAFALIGLRYLVMSACKARLYLLHLRVAARAGK